MTGTEDVPITNPLALLDMEELMGLLVENEMLAAEFAHNIRDIRAELKERIFRGDPYDYIVKDPKGGEMGFTITAHRTKGQHRWKYNPKQVMNRMVEMGDNSFIKRSLDAKTFNSALNENEALLKKYSDIVTGKHDDDKLQIKGMKELLKARGVVK